MSGASRNISGDGDQLFDATSADLNNFDMIARNKQKSPDAPSSTNVKQGSESGNQKSNIAPSIDKDDQFRVTYADSVNSPFQKTGAIGASSTSPRYKGEEGKQAHPSSNPANKTAVQLDADAKNRTIGHYVVGKL